MPASKDVWGLASYLLESACVLNSWCDVDDSRNRLQMPNKTKHKNPLSQRTIPNVGGFSPIINNGGGGGEFPG